MSENNTVDENIEEYPTAEWECDKCGTVNTEWIENPAHVLNKSKPTHFKGRCTTCEEERKRRDEMRKRAQKRAEQRRYTQFLRKSSGLPPRIKDASFEMIKKVPGNSKAYEALRNIHTANEWLNLVGDNATGKTILMAASLNEMLKKYQIPAIYLHERRFFNEIIAKFGTNENAKSKIQERLKRVEIVFWDEFMMTNLMKKRSDFFRECVYDVLDDLDAYAKIVVFASNIDPHYNPKTLMREPWIHAKERLGKRITSRLERNKTRVIHLTNDPFTNSKEIDENDFSDVLPPYSLN